ncbi:MAG: hypothetical protein WC378_14680 [Opitutaceae bacterium]|jgi:hypothetical protein
MNSHTNSAASLAQERDNGRLGRRAEAVLMALRSFQSPPTDRMIAEKLGYADLNAVRPRITELIELGLVVEMRSTTCQVTGKTVRTTRALHPAEIEIAQRAAAAAPMQKELTFA